MEKRKQYLDLGFFIAEMNLGSISVLYNLRKRYLVPRLGFFCDFIKEIRCFILLSHWERSMNYVLSLHSASLDSLECMRRTWSFNNIDLSILYVDILKWLSSKILFLFQSLFALGLFLNVYKDYKDTRSTYADWTWVILKWIITLLFWPLVASLNNVRDRNLRVNSLKLIRRVS